MRNWSFSMEPIDRSRGMILAAYFMAQFGEPGGRGHHQPPEEMGTAIWVEAYERLFPALGNGRSFTTFRRSIDQDRRHYLDCLAGRKTDSEERRAILGNAVFQSREELWMTINQFLN
jgi:hypothetical protein